jgi:tripartite-type tricarboxylate transporter receptor subunit TctC
MRKMSNCIIRAIAALGLVVGAIGSVPAQDYPARPIRIVVPFTPGGPTDAFARVVAQGLTGAFGKPVIVDNKPGASGILGTDIVAKAPPDGYTLLLIASGHAVSPSLYRKLPYDTQNDFTPVTLVAISPNVVVSHPSLPANSIKELIALAKASPGRLNYASTAGIGGASHLSAELLKSMAGIDIVHIPYKGNAPALNDLLAGRVTFMITGVGPMLQHIKAGKLKALAVTSPQRLAVLPDVPTVDETLPGYLANSWWGILGPARMPKDVVDRLNAEIAKVLNSPDAKQRFLALDAEVGGNSPQAFGAFLKAEMDKWDKVVKSLGLQLDSN